MSASMRRARRVLAGVALALAGLAFAADPPKGESVRPEVGKPLMAAQELLKSKSYREALAKIDEAAAVPDRTEFESLTIQRMRGVAAAGAGDYETAASAFESVITSGKLSAPEQLLLMEALAGIYYRAKDYPKTIAWASRYVKEGGADPRTRALLGQALFLGNDFAGAAAELQSQVDGHERKDEAAPEEKLRMLASAYAKIGDNAGYASTVERLVARYPKKEYWLELISRAQGKPGFADRFSLDIYRLLRVTGNLSTASQYLEMGELCIHAGLPAEAKMVLNQGIEAGAFGSGTESERKKKVRELANKQLAEDGKMQAQIEAGVLAAKDGIGLVNLGLAYIASGDYERGLKLMEQGLRKGVSRHPEDAKLHLGVAYVLAGQKAKAIETLKTVQGSDGSADLARLWILVARS